MITYIEKRRTRLTYRLLSAFICLAFTVITIMPPVRVHAQVVSMNTVLNLPIPGTMVSTTDTFFPSIIRGLTINPENPLNFDFIIDTGDDDLKGESFKTESSKLIKYFLASLTVPEKELWVNLSPYEKDRIIPEGLGVTEMGRDMLAQDYLLKQLTSSLMYPEEELGEEFWDRVHERAFEEYGSTNIPINTFNKVWIVPDKAVVYTHQQSVFVGERHLKVMLEEDYLALQENLNHEKYESNNVSKNSAEIVSGISSEVVREVLIPEIEKEVNKGKHFANLRQIFNSMILATWYKKNLKESLLGKVYMDQNKTNGVDIADRQTKQKIYDQYVESFKKGVYDYIKEDYDPATQEIVPRKYFSGGVMNGAISTKKIKEINLDRFPQAEWMSRTVPQLSRGSLKRVEGAYDKYRKYAETVGDQENGTDQAMATDVKKAEDVINHLDEIIRELEGEKSIYTLHKRTKELVALVENIDDQYLRIGVIASLEKVENERLFQLSKELKKPLENLEIKKTATGLIDSLEEVKEQGFDEFIKQESGMDADTFLSESRRGLEEDLKEGMNYKFEEYLKAIKAILIIFDSKSLRKEFLKEDKPQSIAHIIKSLVPGDSEEFINFANQLFTSLKLPGQVEKKVFSLPFIRSGKKSENKFFFELSITDKVSLDYTQSLEKLSPGEVDKVAKEQFPYLAEIIDEMIEFKESSVEIEKFKIKIEKEIVDLEQQLDKFIKLIEIKNKKYKDAGENAKMYVQVVRERFNENINILNRNISMNPKIIQESADMEIKLREIIEYTKRYMEKEINNMDSQVKEDIQVIYEDFDIKKSRIERELESIDLEKRKIISQQKAAGFMEQHNDVDVVTTTFFNQNDFQTTLLLNVNKEFTNIGFSSIPKYSEVKSEDIGVQGHRRSIVMNEDAVNIELRGRHVREIQKGSNTKKSVYVITEMLFKSMQERNIPMIHQGVEFKREFDHSMISKTSQQQIEIGYDRGKQFVADKFQEITRKFPYFFKSNENGYEFRSSEMLYETLEEIKIPEKFGEAAFTVLLPYPSVSEITAIKTLIVFKNGELKDVYVQIPKTSHYIRIDEKTNNDKMLAFREHFSSRTVQGSRKAMEDMQKTVEKLGMKQFKKKSYNLFRTLGSNQEKIERLFQANNRIFNHIFSNKDSEMSILSNDIVSLVEERISKRTLGRFDHTTGLISEKWVDNNKFEISDDDIELMVHEETHDRFQKKWQILTEERRTEILSALKQRHGDFFQKITQYEEYARYEGKDEEKAEELVSYIVGLLARGEDKIQHKRKLKDGTTELFINESILDDDKILLASKDFELLPKDYSMAAELEKGGIDFDPANLDLQTRGDGEAFNFANILAPCLEDDNAECSKIELEQLNINGLVPVIFQITPVTNPLLLLGISDKQEPFNSAQDDETQDLTFDDKYRNYFLYTQQEDEGWQEEVS